MAARARLLGHNVPIAEIDHPNEVATTFANALPVLPLTTPLQAKPGVATPSDAPGVIEAITRSVDLVRQRAASAVVTLPINKKSLYDAGFSHPGHTEFLGELARDWPGHDGAVRPVMLLAGPSLMAVPITVHIPLKDVAAHLSADLIVETAHIVAADLKKRIGIKRPRLAFSGLNPHAGEGGALGREDLEIIAPALERLRADGVDCLGPLPADTMFHAAARQRYDVALCMYHDQALIPVKALGFDEAVNVTLGLPFVRTSPDHGTAFDIAGTGKASPSSFIAALKMARKMVST